VPEFIDPVFT